MKKLVILLSHPIQYLIPLFQALEEREDIDTEIWFNTEFGDKPFYDPDFKKLIKWDIDLHGGYNFRFLKNFSPRPSTNLFGQINPGVIRLLLGKDRPDVMMIWGWNSITNILAIIVAKFLGIRLLLRAETTLDYEQGLSPIKRLVKAKILSQFFRLFDGFLYLGEQNLKYYEHMGIEQGRLYFMPYCVHRYSQQMSDRHLTQLQHFIFVGKLTPKKRPDTVLDAFLQLKTKYPQRDIRLTFVGSGEMQNNLIKRSKGNSAVHFYGFANQSELKGLYQKHDVVILASDQRETWGLVINEAISYGLAAITSDKVGCRQDLIAKGVNGEVFPLGDVNSLLNIMSDMVEGRMKLDGIREQNMKLSAIYNHDSGAATLAKLCHDYHFK